MDTSSYSAGASTCNKSQAWQLAFGLLSEKARARAEADTISYNAAGIDCERATSGSSLWACSAPMADAKAEAIGAIDERTDPVEYTSNNMNLNELCHTNHVESACREEWINDHVARKAAPRSIISSAMMQYLLGMLIPVQFMSTNLHPNELCHNNHMVPARCAEWIKDHCARKDAHLVDQKKCHDVVLIDDPDPVALITSDSVKHNVLYHKDFVEPVRCEEWNND